MANESYEEVGRVVGIFRYPVKSMRGEALSRSHVGWHGLDGDRRYGYIRSKGKAGFPWLTAREVPSLVTFAARCANAEDPERSPVRVGTPDGAEHGIEDAALASKIAALAGEDIRLVHLARGTFDAADVSLITTQSMDNASREAGLDTDLRRFRPNLVVEAFGERAFPEDDWVSALLVFGDRPDSARVRMYRNDRRCVVVNIDPDTGQKRGELSKVIARSRDNQLGVYAGTERPGTVALGDAVRILR